VDLCWRRRDEVIEHVYEAYGRDRVAMISTHATLGPRSAFREAAKALGVPLPRVNALARRVPRGELPDASALEKTLHADSAAEFREPRIAEALRLATRLAGAPRHLSIHCGGLVIADRELTHYLPLERSAKGVVVSQFEMRAVEAIGLVKMDLLGNRAITTIGECVALATTALRGAGRDTRDAEASPPAAERHTRVVEASPPRAERRTRLVEASPPRVGSAQADAPLRHPAFGSLGAPVAPPVPGSAPFATPPDRTPLAAAPGETMRSEPGSPAMVPGCDVRQPSGRPQSIGGESRREREPWMAERPERLATRGQDARGERPPRGTADAPAAPQRGECDAQLPEATPRRGECDAQLPEATPRRGACDAQLPEAAPRQGACDVTLDPEQVSEDDPLTAAAVAAGDTLNCFQLESPAMRHLLRMLRAGTLDATVAAVALVRPGPAESGMKEAFCRRARGLEPVTVPHERLRGTLAETHGVMLYEEDVMRVAAALCGLPLAEGETLRRAIAGARDDEEFRFLERGFLAQAARGGIAPADARTVWRELARFAGYAFCKAHAAGYGRLAWQCAYFKTHLPAAWAVGILNHHAGMYPTWAHVEDLRRHGVVFLPPCARASAWETTLAGAPGPGGVVRVGLHRVTGLSHATGTRLLAERAARPFAGLADLADRARPTPPELESLVLAGALDWTGRSRAALLLEARVGVALSARANGRRAPEGAAALLSPAGVPLAPAAAPPRPGGEALPELPEFSVADRVRGEFAATGLWFSAHPLVAFGADDARRGCVGAGTLERHAGRRVTVCGIPCASRRTEAKGGGFVLFTTLADETGLAECVLFPRDYARLGPAMRGEIVRAEGRVDETLGALTLVVERAAATGAPPRGAAGAPPNARTESPAARAGESGPPSRYRVSG